MSSGLFHVAEIRLAADSPAGPGQTPRSDLSESRKVGPVGKTELARRLGLFYVSQCECGAIVFVTPAFQSGDMRPRVDLPQV